MRMRRWEFKVHATIYVDAYDEDGAYEDALEKIANGECEFELECQGCEDNDELSPSQYRMREGL